MKKMRVLEVIRQGQVGGGESHLLDLVAGFSDDVEPVVLSFTDGQMVEEFRSRGIICHVIPSGLPFDPRVISRVIGVVKSEHIDLIHAHGSRAVSNVLPVAKLLGKPLFYTVHGWSFHVDQSRRVFKLRAFCESLFCRFADQVICVSEANREAGQRLFDLSDAVVIENGVDVERFSPDLNFSAIRRESGFSEDDFVIGFIGRVEVQKDPLLFVRSVEEAHRHRPSVKGLFVGEGVLKQEVLDYIASHQLQDVIVTMPYRQDVPALLSAIDVFCLPSLWEGLSISLLEAMSMGKAIVATPTDGTKELVENGVCGELVAFGDCGELVEKYLFYYDHPEVRKVYGVAARNKIRRFFNSRNVSVEVEQLYLKQIGVSKR